MKIDLEKILLNEKYIIGCNYWSKAGGPFMYRDECWDPKMIRKEMQQMKKEMGMNCIRAFVMTPDLYPKPYRFDKKKIRRVRHMCDIAEEEGLDIMLSMLVGHMSGQNFNLPWLHGLDMFTNPVLSHFLKHYSKNLVKKLDDKPAIKGWIVSNEMPLYIMSTHNEAKKLGVFNKFFSKNVTNFLEGIVKGIRKADSKGRLVTIGDGMLSDEFRADELFGKGIVDYSGPHKYFVMAKHADAITHSMDAMLDIEVMRAFASLKSNDPSIVFEEFGSCSSQTGYEKLASYVRENMVSTLLAGGVGAQVWCYGQMNKPLQPPYNHQPWENDFGLVKEDGTIKPAGYEIRRISKIIDKIDLKNYTLERDGVGLIIPSYMYMQHDFTSNNQEEIRRFLLESFTLTKMAGMSPQLMVEPEAPYEVDLEKAEGITKAIKNGGVKWKDISTSWGFPKIPDDVKLIILGGNRKLQMPTWYRLKEFVEDGGTVYSSFFAGSEDYHQGMFWPDAEYSKEMFGIVQDGTFGVQKSLAGKQIEIYPVHHDAKKFYPLKYTGLSGHCGESRAEFTFDKHDLTSGRVEILAVDQKLEAAILKTKVGKGQTIFSRYPLEYYLINSNEPHGEVPPVRGKIADKTHDLYAYVGESAGIKTVFNTNCAEVEVGHLMHKDRDDDIAILMNHSWKKIEDTLSVRLDDFDHARDIESGKILSTGGTEINYILKPKDYLFIRFER